MTSADDTTNYAQLLRLLREDIEAFSSGAVNHDDPREERLLEWLSGSFVMNTALLESNALESHALRDALRRLPNGASLGDVLLDPTTPLEVLALARNHFKTLAKREAHSASVEHAAATALYYAAAAAELVYHNRLPANTCPEEFAESLNLMCGKTWLPAELPSMMARARAKIMERQGLKDE